MTASSGEIGMDEVARRDRAFRSAITPLMDVAYRVLRRLGVKDREIDDALQSVLVVVDRRFDDIPTAQELKAYVCGVCANAARDIGRRRTRHSRTRTLEEGEEPSAAAPDPEDALGRKQGLAIVQRILETMEEERRVVFVLYELEELTGQEIAEHLGVPIGTVSSRLRKAREDFRGAIARIHASERHLGRRGR